MYAQQLELSGFDVIEAANGADALTQTATHSPDVVLMDLEPPGPRRMGSDAPAEERRAHRAHSGRRAHGARRCRRAAAGHAMPAATGSCPSRARPTP